MASSTPGSATNSRGLPASARLASLLHCGHSHALVEGADDSGGQHERPPAGADRNGRVATVAQRREYVVDVPVEGGVEGPIGVVEVAGPPDVGGFVAGPLQAELAHCVMDEHPAGGAVEL